MWIHMPTSVYGLSITLEKLGEWPANLTDPPTLQCLSTVTSFMGERQIQTQALLFVHPAPLSYLPISKQAYFLICHFYGVPER